MRELKFRAWDVELGIMHKYDRHHLGRGFGTLLFGFEPMLDHNKKLEGYILEQFSGTTDKDGVDIYEGDILEWIVPDVLRGTNSPTARYYVMRYEESGFGAESLHEYPYSGHKFWNHIQFDCTIVGNIHEDSELLEVEL